MTALTVLVAAVGAALAVHLGWPRDALRRLRAEPRLPWPRWLGARESAMSVRMRRSAGAAVAALVVVLGGPAPLSLGLGAVVGAVVFWVLGKVETGGAAIARAELIAELPTALDLLASCVASGMPLRSATTAVARAVGGPLGDRLAGVVARTSAGFSDGAAWASLRGDEVLGPVARDLARAADAGTPAGPLLARHAEAARSAAHADALVRARAVGVRTIIPVACCYLPAFFLLGVVPVIAGVLESLLR